MTTPRPRGDVLRMTSTTERDVFTVRQRGREIAEAVGLDRQDQHRLAAALSDVGRDLVRHGITAAVAFTLDDGLLRAEFSWQGEPPERVLPAGRTTATRLLDAVDSPEGIDLSSTGLGAALLPKSQLSVETIRFAITEALMVLPRTVRE